MRIEKNNEKVLNELATIYFNLEMYWESIFYYEKLITVSNVNPWIYANLGWAYHKIQAEEKAIYYFEKSL